MQGLCIKECGLKHKKHINENAKAGSQETAIKAETKSKIKESKRSGSESKSKDFQLTRLKPKLNDKKMRKSHSIF